MFFFAHVGFTLAAALAITGISANTRSFQHRDSANPAGMKKSPVGTNYGRRFSPAAWIKSLIGYLDIRLLVIGSMLPDIVDKPLALLVYGEGRIFTHSLVVTLVLLIGGLWLFLRSRRTGLLALSGGMLAHLLLDQMWANPGVFLWPLHGWIFPEGERTLSLGVWIQNLTRNEPYFIAEIAGLVIVVLIGLELLRTRQLSGVIRKGRIRS